MGIENSRAKTVRTKAKPTDDRLLEAFAMHAPSDIPDWFDGYQHIEEPVVPEFQLSTHELNVVNAVVAGRGQIAVEQFSPNRVNAMQLAIDVLRHVVERRDQIRRANQMNRYFAWRWFYAAQMLKARPTAGEKTPCSA